MTSSFSDTELELVLTDLGARLAVPEFSLAPRVRNELEHRVTPALRRAPRLLLVTAAVLAIIVVATLAITPARDAVARFLGLGTTHVEPVDKLPAAAPRDSLPSRGDVQRLFADLHDADLYAPDAALVGTPVAWDVDPDAATTVAWPTVILAQEVHGAPVTKLVPRGGGSRFVNVGTVSGLWIPGRHVREVGGRRFESDSALVWVDHGIEFRLEGDLSLARMLAIARSLRPA